MYIHIKRGTKKGLEKLLKTKIEEILTKLIFQLNLYQ